MNTQVNKGKSIETTAGAAIASGALVLVGAIVGIAANSYATGDNAVVWLQGTHIVPKAAEAWTQGAKLYYDSTNKNITVTVGTNTFAGYAAAAAAIGDATGLILLRQ